MRERLAALKLSDVNAALKMHWSAQNLRVVCVTKDVDTLKQALLGDATSTMTYEAAKPQDLLDEDKRIGARKLSIKPENLRVIAVDDVFAK
jgi:zinc protease